MSAPKPVSDDTYTKITSAMKAIAADPELRRTKRQIEQLAGLSHDVVARAFRQDKQNDGKPWGINNKYNELTAGSRTAPSPQEQENRQLRAKIDEQAATIREQKETLDAYAAALYAHTLQHEDDTRRTERDHPDAIPIGKNRDRRRE